MIAAVEQHIIDRLKLVKKGGKAVTVYGPGAARPKGKQDTRCFILSRFLPPQLDTVRSKPYLEEAEPSTQQATVTFPNAYDENGQPVTITGPDHYTFRKLRLPHVLHYQIDISAVTLTDLDAMYVGLSEVLEMPYAFKIGVCPIMMTEADKPMDLSEIEAPLFRSAYRYRVSNVWIKRSKSWTVPGIKSIGMGMRDM